MDNKKSIKIKFVLFKCYIDGKLYYYNSDESYSKRQYNAYHKDLIKHIQDGSWEKSMTPNTPEYNRYLYNYREMNSKFIPVTLNKTDKADIKWSAKKHSLLWKYTGNSGESAHPKTL